MRYKGRIALVTGGTGDLGRAIVARLLQQGLGVAFTYARNQAAAEQLVQAYPTHQLRAFQLENPDLEKARSLVSEIKAAWGGLHYLVNNIGQLQDKSFLRMEQADWAQSISINLDSVFAFCRAVLFDQIKTQTGAIVNITSIAGITGAVGQANYAAAKAGVIGLTRSLAREAGHFGVRVNAVAPGYIISRMTETLPERIKLQAQALIPLQRFGQPDEVAHAVAFLLSEEARYINGQTLAVDGGIV